MKKWHLWMAASIGLVVIVGMMIREFDVEALSRIDLSPRFFLGVVMGVLLFAVQNLMLTLRFRHLCQRKLSIAEAFRINVLCEFTSAVTPSAVGGSGLDSHSLPSVVASPSDSGMGIEGMLQDSFPSEIPA